jgi:hypothetical protein
MPRQDPRFTDADLIRFYCNNLDDAEKSRVRKVFNDYLMKQVAICPDAEDGNGYCEWARVFRTITKEAKRINGIIPDVIAALKTIEILLNAFSFAGLLGRLVVILKIFISSMLEYIVYLSAVLAVVIKMEPYAEWLEGIFCSIEGNDNLGEIVGDLPDISEIGLDPLAGFVGDIQQTGQDFLNWFKVVPADFNPDIGPWP